MFIKPAQLASSVYSIGKGSLNQSLSLSPSISSEQSMADAVYDSLQEQMAFQTQSAQDAMAFSAEQAQLNREWQERMSNTAYTRAVSDLKNAGINPIYAVGAGAASTPSGASASGVAQSGASSDYGSVAQYRAATGSILNGVGAIMKGSAALVEAPSSYLPWGK